MNINEHIYELRYLYEDEWYTFYVGRTTDLEGRHRGHQSATNKGTTDVYCFMRDLSFVNISWDIFSVMQYDKADYIQQEDDHILECLFQNIDLMNMKKGDAKWKERTLANMSKAKAAGCKTVKEFTEWDRVQRQLEREAKAAKRLEEELKIPLIDRIKAQTKFTDKEKLRLMEAQHNQQKADAILMKLKR